MPKRPEVSPAPRQSLMLERKAQVTGTLRTEDRGAPAGTSEGPGNVQTQGSTEPGCLELLQPLPQAG